MTTYRLTYLSFGRLPFSLTLLKTWPVRFLIPNFYEKTNLSADYLPKSEPPSTLYIRCTEPSSNFLKSPLLKYYPIKFIAANVKSTFSTTVARCKRVAKRFMCCLNLARTKLSNVYNWHMALKVNPIND